MNPVIKKLAEESGFCFWEDEEWKPKDAVIDWSAEYDDEFQKYSELLIGHLTQRLLNDGFINIPIACQIREEYGIRNESRRNS